MSERKEVDLGGGIVATIRCPDMLIWSEWEAILTEDQEAQAAKSREDKIVEAYEAREKGHDPPPETPKTERQRRKLNPRAVKFMENELTRDCLVTLKVGEEVYEMQRETDVALADGSRVRRLRPVEPPPYDLRDLRFWRFAALVNGITDLVYGAAELSFRAAGEARASEEAPGAEPSDGEEPAELPLAAGVGGDG